MSEISELQETLKMVAESAVSFAPVNAQRARRVRDEFEGHDPDFWQGMAEQGWLGVLLPEELGGTGLGVRAAALIVERLGYACHSEPFVASGLVVASALLACPPSARRSALLDDLVSGRRVLALAWQSPSGELEINSTQVFAKPSSNGYLLSGSSRFVISPNAQSFLVLAEVSSGGHRVLLLGEIACDAKGLRISKEKRSDGGFSARLDFEETPLAAGAVLACDHPGLAQASQAVQLALDTGVLCTSAELLGLISRSLDLTLSYLAQREQFGQAIGTFQVLQHRVVDMWMQKELTRAALNAALDIFENPLSSSTQRRAAASSAKSRASQTALLIAAQAVQLHGAIGTTDEYELGVYVNRSLALASDFGNAAVHRHKYGVLTPVQEAEINDAPLASSGMTAEALDSIKARAIEDFNLMSDEAFRTLVRIDFEGHYPKSLRYVPNRLRWSQLREWYLRMSAKGWIAPSWPREAGGMGLSPAKLLIFLEEQERCGIARFQDHGIQMVGPVLLRYGTEAQKKRFLPKILSCENIWSQGYSEPGSGSDLASLRTKAERVEGVSGPEFLVNGQKIWTTLAQDATHMFVLVRTDPGAKKQKGISFLLVDIASPGITVRPIRDIGGHEEFCEVFFDNVHVPLENLVGELNDGWTIAKSLLGFERIFLGSPKLPEFGLQMLMRIARLAGSHEDPVFRDKFATLQLDVTHLADAYTGYANMLIRGETLGSDVSMLKIWSTETFQRIADLCIETAGASGALVGDVAIGVGKVNALGSWYKARPATIYGGSNEIQRNILARQVLGLPSA
jgi:3-oxochol-4-en-24-oyl-CoA dehydrogenase